MSFTSSLLKENLNLCANAKTFWVAYSGGCDSHVLLHALVRLRDEINAEIKAIHINHGLSPFAKEWEEHCRQVCQQLSVSYTAISVNAKMKNASPEEAARKARYAEWHKLVQKDEALLLAHHQDDQSETVLLQLFRGAGVKGLAAMPTKQSFSQGYLVRPFLNFSREELTSYALEHGLQWIDDPSNFDTDFDRNFLRHEVVPLLEERWPSLKKTLARTASHMGEANQLLNNQALQDWLQVRDEQQLRIKELAELEYPRQRNLIRYWLSEICQLSLPDTVHLQRIIDEVLPAAIDAKPEVIWNGGEVRRFQGLLYAQKLHSEPCNKTILAWKNISQPLDLGHQGRVLTADTSIGEGLSHAKLLNANISVRFREGGELCRPKGRGQTHQLKKLFQEWQIPPWLRASVPLVYVNDELAQVVGYCYCEPYAAVNDEKSWNIREFTAAK